MIRVVNEIKVLPQDYRVGDILICNSPDLINIDLSKNNIYTIRTESYMLKLEGKYFLICERIDDIPLDWIITEVLDKHKTLNYIISAYDNNSSIDINNTELLDLLYNPRGIYSFPKTVNIYSAMEEYELFTSEEKIQLNNVSLSTNTVLSDLGRNVAWMFWKYQIPINLFTFYSNTGRLTIRFSITAKGHKFDVDIVDSGYIDYFYLRPNYIIKNYKGYIIRVAVLTLSSGEHYKNITKGKIHINKFEKILVEILKEMKLID